jgi:uncharacterized protein
MEDKERIYISPTHGKLTEEQVFARIGETLLNDRNGEYTITVGTDSQRHGPMTRLVPVISVYRHGKGGFYFYLVEYIQNPKSIRSKIYEETQKSLDRAKRLEEFLYENEIDNPIIIDVDMGKSKYGKTAELIKEIVGWVTAEGFECHYKPHSATASCVADRITK